MSIPETALVMRLTHTRAAAEIISKTFFHPVSRIEFVTKLSSGVQTSVDVSELLYCDVLQDFSLRATAATFPLLCSLGLKSRGEAQKIKTPPTTPLRLPPSSFFLLRIKTLIAVANAALKARLFPSLQYIFFFLFI